MCWYNILKSTLKKEVSAIILFLFNSSLISLFYYLIYGGELLFYPMCLTITFLGFYLLYKLFIYKNLYETLQEGKDSPKYRISENNPFEDVFDVIREIHKKYISKIYRLESKYEEKDNLLGEWIHNMKTSVAVIELAAEEGLKSDNKNKDIFKDIIEEKCKLQENLESALNLFRVEEFSRDYVPEKVNLKELINSSINSKKRNFIYSKVFPSVKVDENIYVYTDKKWGKYVIEQIISNAIKYSNKENSKVIFWAEANEKKTVLNIEDCGIGIKKEEISRVFNPFFTGSNGRKDEKSSGIGLYMCKVVCERLDNEINIDSTEGVGTKVSISYITAPK